MANPWTAYDKAHEQPFDVNADLPEIDDWGLYNAAHADPDAVPIHSIQASPGGLLTASVSAEVNPPPNDGAIHTQHTPERAASATIAPTEPPPSGNASAEASVAWQSTGDEDAPHAVGGIDANVLQQYEAIAPGLALALVQAEQSRAKQSRMYRLLRLVVTMVIAITAIACGQWALVHGADQQALYLSAAGLISLLTTVLQHE